MSGIEQIAAERERQIVEKRWTSVQDDTYVSLELSRAALSYLVAAIGAEGKSTPCEGYPWDFETFRPGDMENCLTKAGALIAAELDRIERSKEREINI